MYSDPSRQQCLALALHFELFLDLLMRGPAMRLRLELSNLGAFNCEMEAKQGEVRPIPCLARTCA